MRSRTIAATVATVLLVLAPALPGGTADSSLRSVSVPALGGPPGGTAHSKATPATGSRYVALGDSYAAGYGLGDPTGEPKAACGQSAHDYPHRLAATFHLDLTDVTCAGATSADVLTTRQNGAAPRIDALTADTRVVTLTIGGNDAGLFSTASECLAIGPTGPVFAGSGVTSCRALFTKGGTDTLRAAIEGSVSAGLTRTLAAIRSGAPRARVFVVGYPAVFPDVAHTPSGGCFRPLVTSALLSGSFPANAFPFTDTDVVYLHGVQVALDAAMRSAATAAGATFVDALPGSEAHSACATGSAPYVNGVHLTASSDLQNIDLVPGALHPNARGAAYLADTAATAIRTTYARIAAEQAAQREAERRSAEASASASASAHAAEVAHSARTRGAIGWGAVGLVALVVIAAVLGVRARRRRRP